MKWYPPTESTMAQCGRRGQGGAATANQRTHRRNSPGRAPPAPIATYQVRKFYFIGYSFATEKRG